MDKDQNYVTLELNLKLSMQDYRIVLGLKRAWILAAVLLITHILTWLLHS